MKQTLIKAILLMPFLFVNYQFADSVETSTYDEPIELTILKLNLDHTNNQIIKIGSEIEMSLFIKQFENENSNSSRARQ